MKKFKRILFIILIFNLGLTIFVYSSSAADENEKKVRITLSSGPCAEVKGDIAKFRALNWMKNGCSGGFSELYFDDSINKDYSLSFEGHSLPKENDNELEILLRKGDDGFIKTEYKSFRKYYDTTGGVYYPFTVLKVNDLPNKSLKMDMSHFMFEAGLGPVSDPALDLMYERHTKKGIKSRLTWTPVKQGAIQRNIGPAFQQIDEDGDIITLKEKKEVAGITVKSQQKAEFTKSRNLREEDFLANTGVAADTKIRRQIQIPEAEHYSAFLRGEKWMLDDKTFAALGYLYSSVHNTEDELLQEFSRSGVLTSYGANPEQKLPSDAENRNHEHIWTGHLQSDILPNLTLISKLKVGMSSREGSSTYPADTEASPDGIANSTVVSQTETNLNRLGENISIRYSGLPHSSVYAEVETEQSRNWLSEDRRSIPGQSAASANEIFSRGTMTHIQKTIWTVGSRTVPSKYLTVTTQVRQRYVTNDYDDQYESVSAGTAKSAFFDELKVNTDEAETKITLKPYQKLQTSFRYQYLNNKYYPRAENQLKTKNRMLSHIYTYDITYQPVDVLFLNIAYSRQELSTKTPAARNPADSSKVIPGFNAGVNTYLLSTTYSPLENLSIINTTSYSSADNFNDISSFTQPFGAAFEMYDIATSLEWTPPKTDLTIKPTYEYANYQGNSLVDSGDYSAHIFWVEVGMEW